MVPYYTSPSSTMFSMCWWMHHAWKKSIIYFFNSLFTLYFRKWMLKWPVLEISPLWRHKEHDISRRLVTHNTPSKRLVHLRPTLLLSSFKQLAGSIKSHNWGFLQEDVNRGLNMPWLCDIENMGGAIFFWQSGGSMEERWGVAAGQLCSEYKCWTFGAVQKQRRGRLRREWGEDVVPRDESEICKHFGQSFLWNVTESRALWEGDDDAGVFATAPLGKKRFIVQLQRKQTHK